MTLADPWVEAKRVIGDERVTLGPQASQQWLHAPDHLAMVLARYRVAAALIGDAQYVLEMGCGEGIGAGILAKGRCGYRGVDGDVDAIAIARDTHIDLAFGAQDILTYQPALLEACGATVALDVIEHIPSEDEDAFMAAMTRPLIGHGVCVIGTPSANAAHLASPQSRAGHVNLYWPERLRDLMGRHFHTVQMLYMQDVSIHLGHPGMAHYLMGVGIGPR